MKQFLSIEQIKRTLIFFFIVSIISPNLEEYLYYFFYQKTGISFRFEIPYAIGFGALVTIFVVLYNIYLIENTKFRIIVLSTCFCRILSSLLTVIMLKKYFIWLDMTDLVLRSLIQAYLYMPGMIFYSKMVPNEIEASMLGLAYSIILFNSECLARVWSYLLNLYFGVSLNNYSNLWKMYVIQACLLVIPFFFYKLIISRSEVEIVQVVVHHADNVVK